jgi:hypothetical protein
MSDNLGHEIDIYSLCGEVKAAHEEHVRNCQAFKTTVMWASGGIIAVAFSAYVALGAQLLLVTGRQQSVIRWKDQIEHTITADRENMARTTAADREIAAQSMRTISALKDSQITELRKVIDKQEER